MLGHRSAARSVIVRPAAFSCDISRAVSRTARVLLSMQSRSDDDCLGGRLHRPPPPLHDPACVARRDISGPRYVVCSDAGDLLLEVFALPDPPSAPRRSPATGSLGVGRCEAARREQHSMSAAAPMAKTHLGPWAADRFGSARWPHRPSRAGRRGTPAPGYSPSIAAGEPDRRSPHLRRPPGGPRPGP